MATIVYGQNPIPLSSDTDITRLVTALATAENRSGAGRVVVVKSNLGVAHHLLISPGVPVYVIAN
jgi:hypothetical protein